jgi:hypothetical protein
MKAFIGLVALAGVAATAPAAAATFADDYGAAGFSYGTLSGGAFSAYTAHGAGDSACLGLGACYTGNDTYAIIAKVSPTELLVHPGPGTGGNSAVMFTASTTGTYDLSGLLASFDVGQKTGGYFTIINGVLATTTIGTAGNLFGGDPNGAAGTSDTLSFLAALGAGDSVGVFVDNFNGYTGDTTHLSGSITAVPEPASWAMMLGGFGLVGAAMRRRQRVAVRFG